MPYRTSLAIIAALTAIGSIAQNTYDARIVDYMGLRQPCYGSITPVLRIENAGTAVMNTCVVETWKGSALMQSFNWQLAVPAQPGQVRQPVFPTIDGVEVGDILEFRIISVNGQPDQEPIGNVLFVEVRPNLTQTPSNIVRIEVNSGLIPGILTLEVVDRTAQVVAHMGPFDAPATLYEQWVELEPGGCYELRLRQTEPVGFSTVGVWMYCNGSIVMQMGGVSTPTMVSAGFTVGAGAFMGEEALVGTLFLFPNPAGDAVTIAAPTAMRTVRVLDATGRAMLELRPNADRVWVPTEGLAPGRYLVHILTGTGDLLAAPLAVVR